jgi:hypothetical protein
MQSDLRRWQRGSTGVLAADVFTQGSEFASTHRVHVWRESFVHLKSRKRRERRLPSSKPAVSILQLWCTLTFMHVDARLALNQFFGITEGNMAKKAKKAKAKKKTGKKKKK